VTPFPGDSAAICHLTGPDPLRPILVTGLRAAAILNGAGDVSLTREARGGDVEWGGLYAEGIRLTGPCPVTVEVGPDRWSLGEGLTELTLTRWGLRTRHTAGPVEIRQTIAAVEDDSRLPMLGRRLELTAVGAEPVRARLTAGFQPFLAPVLLEGVKPYRYRAELHGDRVEVVTHGFAFSAGATPRPTALATDRRPWDGSRIEGEVGEVTLVHDLELTPGASVTVDYLAHGGFERRIRSAPAATRPCPPADWLNDARRRFEEWAAWTPSMHLPALPEVEVAYDLARGALRQLYAVQDPDITGLVAGYPWYSAVWGRDLAWMLPAVLWLGDAEWAEESLRSMFRYQAHHKLAILGGTPGELPMQVSSGPLFLYGTSDTTLHYPDLLRRWSDHTGRHDLVDELWEPLRAAAAWAEAKVDPGTGLFVNGGEIATMRDATESAGKVHFGFDAVDTTIWDSTDRRDHAIDVEVLYVAMLRAMARFHAARGDPSEAERAARRAEEVSASLRSLYLWPAEGYLADSFGRDGRRSDQVRPNALRAVSAGLLDAETARQVSRRAGADDLSTPWGVRTLSARDPRFRPTAYHDGQVWPIATTWAADAALAVGDVERGHAYLTQQARQIIAEGGLSNECYRGDRPEAFDSCFLLGFSVGPFLTTLFERLWGLEVHADEPRVVVDPRLPPGPPATLSGVRVGDGRMDVTVDADRITVGWSGEKPLAVDGRNGRTSVPAHGTVTLVSPRQKE